MKLTNIGVFSLCLFLTVTSLTAQEVSIRLGENQIGLNQYFTIAISIENDNLRQHSPFPDIEGFVKRGTSSSSSTSFINGQISSSHTITQNYQPTEKGQFTLAPFKMEVNGKSVSGAGTRITVGEPVQTRRRSQLDDPMDNFFNRNSAPTEYIDVKADAFLSLSTSKNEVYVGEGFTTTLAFYVSAANRAELRFFDLGQQVGEIVKKIKQEHCWEENFNIEQINGEPITLNGKQFTRYTVFQATYFPLNVKDVKFPGTDLKLIKYKVAKNPSFFGQNRQEDFVTFSSAPKTVKVKELPPHPLRESVAVGQYQLREKLDKNNLETGQSFNYAFDVVGVGNISAINEPIIPDDDNFDFYAPNTRQNVNRGNGRISGSKSFNYYGIPNEPGTYALGDYFNWVFFNPQSQKYDTLRSEQTVTVTGESRKNEYILSNDVGAFYDRINTEDNTLRSTTAMRWFRWVMNAFVVLVLALTAYMVFKRG